MAAFLTMLWKELTQVSNRRRFAIEKVVVAGGLSWLLLGGAGSELYDFGGGEGGRSYQMLGTFGREMLLYGIALMTAVLSAAGMFYAASIISEEKGGRRLPLLLVTPLSPASIVGAKAVSVFLRMAVVVGAALPVFAALQALGGVDTRMALQGAGFVVSSVWLYSLIGLAASAFTRRAVTAIFLAAGISVAWNMAPVAAAILQEMAGGVRGVRGDLWFALSPFYVFIMHFVEARLGAGYFNWHLSANFAVGAVFLAAAFAAFGPLAAREAAGARAGLRERIPLIRRLGRIRAKHSALSRWLGPGVVSKELAANRPTGAMVALGWFALLWVGFVLVGLAGRSLSVGDLFDAELHQVMFFLESGGLAFIMAVQAATRVAGEKEAGTLQALALTPLGAMRILCGKGAAVLAEQAAPLCLMVAHVYFMLTFTSVSYSSTPPVEWVMAGVGLFLSAVSAVVLGLYFSVFARKAMQAALLTAVIFFFGSMLPLDPAIILMAFALGEGAQAAAGFVFSAAAVVVTMVAAVVALVLARKRGLGGILALILYSFVSRGIAGAMWSAIGSSDRMGVISLMFIPLSLAMPPDAGADYGQVLIRPLVQLATIVWMMLMCVVSFETQVRRSAAAA